ncbi:MAG: MFS transporter [Chloroflexi bacterium]|nr:MFS transporter [Chloroflexota bacterium]MDA1147691.1 MFS transporter [Chloroflexota bacterium]
MADVAHAPEYDSPRQVRVLTALLATLSVQPHVAIWVVYLTEFRDISLSQVGLMEGAFWLVSLAFEIPSGAFSDRFGRRAGFVVGVTVEGTGVLIFALADTFPLLWLSYVLWASGIAFRSGNDGAFLYDALAANGRTQEYAERFGRLHAVLRFATSGGAILGGVLAGLTNLQVAAFAGFVTFVVASPALLFMREPPRTSSSGVSSYRGTLGAAWRLLRDRPALRYIILFETALVMVMPVQFLLFQPFLRQHGVSLVWLGVLVVPIELAAAAGSLLSGRILRRFGIRNIAVAALAAVVSGLLVLASVDHVVALAAFALPQLAHGVLGPTVSSYINTRATSDVRATVLSVGPFGNALLFAVMAPLAGVAGDSSLRLAFALAALLILVAAGATLLLWLRADRLPPPVDTPVPLRTSEADR